MAESQKTSSRIQFTLVPSLFGAESRVAVPRILSLALVLFAFPSLGAQRVVTFDHLLSQPGQNRHDVSTTVEAVTLLNHYNPDWDSWSGFALSTVSNTTDGSWLNQYAAIAPRTNAYAVAYHGWPAPEILFDVPAAPRSVWINNTTYAGLSIQNGSDFSAPFGDGDYFRLTVSAYDLEDRLLAATNHYLADYRDGKTFIQTNWTRLDLSWMPPSVASLVWTLETSDIGAWGPNTPMYFALAELAYAYGDVHSGLAATHPSILGWADGVADYSPGPGVSNQFANPLQALGPADPGDGFSGSTNVVSLGDGGSIVLTFPHPITDGPGPDFVVFENALSPDFLELAYVEASSDGTTFVRFPCHAIEPLPIDTYAATNASDATAYGGLAGKHLQGIGTPFDLRALAGEDGIDVRRVTHLRLVDILGDGSTTDDYGNPIYDPTPTWGSAGFDLDAIGILHPFIPITPHPDTPAPVLDGFETHLEYKARLDDPDWTPTADRRAPGFYRYRFQRP